MLSIPISESAGFSFQAQHLATAPAADRFGLNRLGFVKSFQRIATALFVGCVIAAVPSILQSHFKAGPFLDGVCEAVRSSECSSSRLAVRKTFVVKIIRTASILANLQISLWTAIPVAAELH
jgi:hypothetical protein